MNLNDALKWITDVMRRKQLALATEQNYRDCLKRYCEFVVKLPAHLSSEQKMERFLTALVGEDVAARTQNQAFDAIIILYGRTLTLPRMPPGRSAAVPAAHRVTGLRGRPTG